MKTTGSAYTKRNDVLERLGYDDYKEYLSSPFWAGLRQLIFKRDRWSCRCCGAKAQAIHHDSYSRRVMRGSNHKPLYAVCNPCHDQIERDESGGKRPFKEARAVFREMLTAHGKATADLPVNAIDLWHERDDYLGRGEKLPRRLCLKYMPKIPVASTKTESQTAKLREMASRQARVNSVKPNARAAFFDPTMESILVWSNNRSRQEKRVRIEDRLQLIIETSENDAEVFRAMRRLWTIRNPGMKMPSHLKIKNIKKQLV